jgi:hypothetical protein
VRDKWVTRYRVIKMWTQNAKIISPDPKTKQEYYVAANVLGAAV